MVVVMMKGRVFSKTHLEISEHALPNTNPVCLSTVFDDKQLNILKMLLVSGVSLGARDCVAPYRHQWLQCFDEMMSSTPGSPTT